jgi:hypothetical protein
VKLAKTPSPLLVLKDMARFRCRTLLLLLLLAPALSCHRSPDPESRATEILKTPTDDYEHLHYLWKKDVKNWDLGLKGTVSWKGPDSTAAVETIRDIRTEDLLGCLPKGFSAPVYFQTSVSVAKSREDPVAVFHWLNLDAATAGQKQVQAAVAATQGDPQKLYEAIQHDASLDKACVMFAGKRDLCAGGGESSG